MGPASRPADRNAGEGAEKPTEAESTARQEAAAKEQRELFKTAAAKITVCSCYLELRGQKSPLCFGGAWRCARP